LAWLELVALGLTIAFSPPHLGLLFWLMPGPHGLVRASLLVGSWLAISALTIGILAIAIQGSIAPLWILPKASTGMMSALLDGLAAMALVTVAGFALLTRHGNRSQAEGVLQQRLQGLPFPLMLALSCGCQLLSPEDGFLYARALNQLKQAGIQGAERFGAITMLWLISSSLMILPLVLLGAMGAMRTGHFLEPIKRGLVDHGVELGAILSLGLAGYLGWQGWTAMQAMG
jgi:hypothetical protein